MSTPKDWTLPDCPDEWNEEREKRATPQPIPAGQHVHKWYSKPKDPREWCMVCGEDTHTILAAVERDRDAALERVTELEAKVRICEEYHD